MTELNETQKRNLENILKDMDARLYIVKLDYDNETVKIGYIRNRGTEDEWLDDNFLEVNVKGDSRAAVIRDVVKNVFDYTCR